MRTGRPPDSRSPLFPISDGQRSFNRPRQGHFADPHANCNGTRTPDWNAATGRQGLSNREECALLGLRFD